MDVCKCTVPSRQGGTLNNRRAACPLFRLVEREEKWEDSGHLQDVLPQNWVEPNLKLMSPAWSTALRLTIGVHPALCRDEFREPRSDIVR
ncbi:uncharacterized protein TNCV_2454261 [Trichonephila clavipes]|nr:uncharacterized protein TNCV_2454261 [Trichonephila clavipes]